AHLVQVLSTPVVWLAALAFLLYAPIEGALGTWAGTYLTDLGHRPRRVAAWLSAFWLTFLGARLLAAWFQQRALVLGQGSEPWFIGCLAFLAAVALGNLAGTRRPTAAARGLLVLGGLLGP